MIRTEWPKTAILDAIEPGGSTAAEIARATGIPKKTLSVRLVAYREAGYVHIVGTRRSPNTRGQPAAIYKLGGG